MIGRYERVFPEKWRMTLSIATEFCNLTRRSLSDSLEADTSITILFTKFIFYFFYFDFLEYVLALVSAVKTTIEFETQMSNYFLEHNFFEDEMKNEEEEEECIFF